MYGPRHLKVAWSANLLGNVYRQLKQYDLSRQYLEEAQEIFNSNLDKNSIKVAWNLYNFGLYYKDQNQFGKAEENFEKVLNIYTKNNGMEHKRTSLVLVELGYIKFLKGDVIAGEKIIQDALDKMIEKGCPHRYSAFLKLAEINIHKLRADHLPAEKESEINSKILQYMNKAMEVVSNNFPSDSFQVKTIKNEFSRYLNISPNT